MGAIVEKQVCVNDNTDIIFFLSDSYGDGLGGAQFGGIDGTWLVYTECGDTISQGQGDFGSLWIDVGTVAPCAPQAVEGCTDAGYLEFDPFANTDDGSCLYYDVTTVTGAGNPYWLNDSCYAWVVYGVDPYCLNNTWDAFCQSQYNYCANGTPLDIEDMTRDKILIYPNPTSGIINLKAVERIDVDVYDMLGNIIIHQKEVEQIDLSEFVPGVYNLQIKIQKSLL